MGERISRPRRTELSFGNLLFCAMVLLLHICSDTIVSAPKGTAFFVIVYSIWKLSSVAVYGFLFLGGLKACMGKRQPLKTYYLRRVRSIVLPYLVWGVLYYIVRQLVGHEPFSLPQLLKQLALGETASHLYFVIAIVQFYALIPLWRVMVDRLPAVVVLPVLAALAALAPDFLMTLWQRWLPGVPPYLDRFFVSYLFVWCAGCYAGAQYERFSALLRQSRWFLCGAAALTAPLFLYCGYQNDVYLQWYSFITPLQQLYCTVMVGAAMALAQRVGEPVMRPWAMQALDRASYEIYLGHMLPLIAAPRLMRMLHIPELEIVRLPLRAAIVLIPTLGACLLWQMLRGLRIRRKIKN